jgi:hypothetical protein
MVNHQHQPALILPSASPEEAAAIMAALEQFRRARAAAAAASPASSPDPWLRTAILEGVSRQEHVAGRDPWINT